MSRRLEELLAVGGKRTRSVHTRSSLELAGDLAVIRVIVQSESSEEWLSS